MSNETWNDAVGLVEIVIETGFLVLCVAGGLFLFGVLALGVST